MSSTRYSDNPPGFSTGTEAPVSDLPSIPPDRTYAHFPRSFWDTYDSTDDRFGSDMHVGVGVHTARDGACLYDGHRHPFLG